jgi:hypothetical protein
MQPDQTAASSADKPQHHPSQQYQPITTNNQFLIGGKAMQTGIPNIGEYVNTPRFLKVRISAIFTEPEDAQACGYTEPTHYVGDFDIFGKNYAPNYARFAVVLKKGSPWGKGEWQ